MNTRTFLKSFAVGTLATIAAPLALFGKTKITPPIKVTEDFEHIEISYIPPKLPYLNHLWQPTWNSLDAVVEDIVQSRKHTKPCYAVMIEYQEDKGSWQVANIIHNPEDEKKIKSFETWNTHMLFDAFFDTPERHQLDKNRYYITFIPL